MNKFPPVWSRPVLLLGVFLWAGLSARAYDIITNAQWELKIGMRSDSSPAVGTDGTVLFGDGRGRLWALGTNGSTKWVFDTSMEIKSSPALTADGRVYFGSRDRHLYALDAGGKLRWKFKTGGWVDSSPALATDGVVYAGSWDGSLYAVNPDGSKRWAFSTGGPIVSSPAIGEGGVIYFGSHDRKFYAVSPAGQKVWEFATGGPIISSPAIGPEGEVYFTSVDGYCHAVNRDGQRRWKLQTGGITGSSPVVSPEGNVYLGVNRHLWNISAQGQKRWARLDETEFEATPLLLADGTVCFVSRYGMLKVLVRDDVEWDDRQLRWMFHLYGPGFASPGIGPDGTLFAPGKSVMFQAMESRARLAGSSWPKFRGNARNTGNVADGR